VAISFLSARFLSLIAKTNALQPSHKAVLNIRGVVSGAGGRGYLPEEARGDPVAIKAAIEVVISNLAFELEQERSKGSGPRF
jgi:hypothetical protein